MSEENRFDTARYDARRVRAADERRRALTAEQRAALRRKGRRRRFFLRAAAWLVCVVVASLALSGVGWLLVNDFAALNKEPLSATITVTKDDNLASVAGKLKDAGLIEYKWLFKLFGKMRHAEGRIGIGTYELDAQMDYNALINGMRSNSGSLVSETVRITFQEGMTVRQTVALMAEYGVNSEEALLDAAANYEFPHAFVDNDRKGDITRLEGYLFPDTYEFYVGGDPATALGRMLNNFANKVDDDLLAQVEESGFTLDQIITVASLIEKETDGHDRANIASVIYNRLAHAGETAYLLQIDASLIYGLGDRYNGTLTQAELAYDTPYNLHIHRGLPPTAIANPGLASIKAALEPAETGYYFYALGKDGSHRFFDTYAKFMRFVGSSDYGG